MKIIAGKYKGRIIQMPEGIKPTSNKVREALFEILKGWIGGANFLDLYCGGGAIGIEAFSRGAEAVTFVEDNTNCVKTLKKNLSLLGASRPSSIDIYSRPALKTLDALKGAGAIFDIIFLDPPYYKDLAKNTLIAISNYAILARNGIIIAEIYKKEDLPEDIGVLKQFRICKYGDTKLVFYKM